MGSQLTVDNGELRWRVAQSILSIARRHMSDIEKRAGPSTVELHLFDNSHRFPAFRLDRRDRFYQILCEFIVEELLLSNLLEIPSVDRSVLIRYLTEERSGELILREAKRVIEESKSNGKILLHVRGLLAGGVLFFVLNCRWRVNYGIDTRERERERERAPRKMAIPFRAKDVPMERTEFGYANVAILFTLLSYYYLGLSDIQIGDAITRVEEELKPEEKYNKWMAEVRSSLLCA